MPLSSVLFCMLALLLLQGNDIAQACSKNKVQTSSSWDAEVGPVKPLGNHRCFGKYRSSPLPPMTSLLPSPNSLAAEPESFLETPIKSQTVVEGQDLDLHCVVAGDDTSALQWSNPRRFVIFLNRHRGLKDKRYKLINSSKDHLSIRLSNVTIDDEGLYTCDHYGEAVTIKQVNVTILAAPSKLLLEESTIRVHGREEMNILKCSTWRSKPPPRITWLLDNGIELFGDTHHQCEGNGKKCNTTSTLMVHTFNQKSTMTCVVRHKALGRGNLTATVHLSHIKSTTDIVPATSEFGMTTLENPWHYPDNILNVMEENFRTQKPSLSSKADTPNSTNTNAESDNILNVTEGNSGAQTTSERNEATTQNPNSTSGSVNIFNITQGGPSTRTTPTSGEAGTLNFTATNKPDKILNVTEGNSSTQTVFPSHEAATLNSNVTSGTNLSHEGIVKEPSKSLPILVAALLSVLFVIVLLFSVKLWKAHREWKRENDSSDLTLESYKTRPNEDNHAHENRHVVGWKSSKKHAAEGSWWTSSKNSEESNGSVFEKQLPHVKETDL